MKVCGRRLLTSQAAPTARIPRVSARSLERVAVVSDVHGNAVAMAAVAREVLTSRPDALVFGGDLTWGPLPEETWRVVTELRDEVNGPAFFVRGNTERVLAELRAGTQWYEPTVRERWMLTQHAEETLDALETFSSTVTVHIAGLGPTRFCHGSPRSDQELITPGTPDERMTALLEEIDERVLVSAHAQIQFDRRVIGIRSLNPGSVGMSYQGAVGAYWALLGPDVEFRRTDYDLDAAAAAYRATDDPLADAIVGTLLAPPLPAEVIAAAEALQCSG
jgi:predicted phosphodiesterase